MNGSPSDGPSNLPPDARWQRLPERPAGWRAGDARPEIVYLDPHADRPVSQYSPEGEIRMMGDFASGLARNGSSLSRPMAFAIVIVLLLPVVLGILALVSTWL